MVSKLCNLPTLALHGDTNPTMIFRLVIMTASIGSEIACPEKRNHFLKDGGFERMSFDMLGLGRVAYKFGPLAARLALIRMVIARVSEDELSPFMSLLTCSRLAPWHVSSFRA